jgi:hypothetical protein
VGVLFCTRHFTPVYHRAGKTAERDLQRNVTGLPSAWTRFDKHGTGLPDINETQTPPSTF